MRISAALAPVAFLPVLLLAGENAPEEPPGDNVHLYADIMDGDEINHLMHEASKAEQAKEWDKALAWYESGLSKYGDALCPTDTRRLYRRLGDCIRARILVMPPEVLSRYRLRLDAEASELIKAALERADPAPAAAALGRLGVSGQARRAAEVLGDLLIEQGETGAAASAWESCALDPTLGGEVPATALAKLAAARAGQGREAEAEALSARVAGMSSALRIAGEEVPASGLGAWLGRFKASAAAVSTGGDWPTVGGNMARSAPSGRAPWVDPAFTWKLDLSLPWTALEDAQLQNAGFPPLKPMVPCHGALADGVFAISSGEVLYLLNPAPGTLKSRWPPSQDRRKIMPEASGVPVLPRPLVVTVAEGIVVTNLLRGGSSEDAPVAAGPWGGMMAAAPRYGLVAVRLKDGKLRWQFPPKQKSAEDDLSIFDFRTAPVICGDTLVAACTRLTTSGEVWLVGLGLADGRLRWKRFLCASSMNAMNGYMPLQAEPGLSAEGGLVVCATQRGALVAVEAETGKARWAYRYESAAGQAGGNRQIQFRGRGFRGMPPDAQGMTAPLKPFSPPMISSGTVYALPADSALLLALDLGTGRPLWQREVESDQLLGMAGSRLVLTGGAKGLLVEAVPGEEAGTFNIPDGGASGRGLLTPDLLMIPTAKGIQGVDLNTLKLTEPVLSWPAEFTGEELPPPPGQERDPKAPKRYSGGANLFVAGGRLFAVGPRKMLAFNISDAPEQTLLSAVQAAPADPQPRLRLVRHYRSERQDQKALDTLREAWKACQDKEVMGLLAGLLREEARRTGPTNPQGAVALLREAASLPLSPEEEADLKLEIGRLLAAGSSPAAALSEFQDVLEHQAAYQVSAAAQQEIAALIQADPKLRAQREDSAKTRLQSAGDDPAKLAAVISAFPESPVADQALLALGRVRLASDPVQGTRVLGACAARHPGSAEAMQALDALASRAEALGNAAWGVAIQKEMERQAALQGRKLTRPRVVAPPDPWEQGKEDPFPLAESWSYPLNERTGLLSVPGESPDAWARELLLSSGQMVDLDTGKLVWQPQESKGARPWMGITYDAPSNTITRVVPGSQAERAGIQPGDRILSLNGTEVPGNALQDAINVLKPGQVVRIKVERESKAVSLDLQLARRPDDSGADLRFQWTAPLGSLVLLGSGREICAYDVLERGLAWRLPLKEAEPEPAALEDDPAILQPPQHRVEGHAACAPSGGVCVVRDEEGGLSGVDVLRGQRLWHRNGEGFGESLASVGDEVVAVSATACHAINRMTGKSRIQIPLTASPCAAPLMAGGRCLLAFPNRVACLDLATGKTVWEQAPFPGDRPSAPMTLFEDQGRLLVVGAHDAAALDLATGVRPWHLHLSDLQVSGLSLTPGVLYLGLSTTPGQGDAVMAVDPAKGTVLWKQALGTEVACHRPERVGRFVAVDGGRDPNDPRGGSNAVLFLDAATGKRIGVVMLPWNRGRILSIRRAGTSILLETSSGITCYAPKGKT